MNYTTTIERKIETTKLNNRIGELATIFIGVLLITLGAQLKVYLPMSPVPITGQTFAIFLLASTLGRKLSLKVISTYLVLGALGLPIFANLKGGINPMSAGYLVGFFFVTLIMGHATTKGFNKTFKGTIASLFLANVALYTCGILGMGIIAGFDKPLLEWGLYPFVIGDMVKMALATISIGSFKKFIYN